MNNLWNPEKIQKTYCVKKIDKGTLKGEFGEYKKILRCSINEAKHLYYARTFALYKHDIKQTWSVIKDPLQKNITARRLTNLF